MRRHETTWLLLALVAGVMAVRPAPLAAQTSGDGYLFRAPIATLSLHGGLARPNAGSDVFDDITDLLTVDRGDFTSFTMGGSVAVPIDPRLDIMVDLLYAGESTSSEFRDWVDDDDLPIEQTTQFRRVPMTLNAKFYPLSRGEKIGTLAWVPSHYAPFVGAGAGVMWYRLRQSGDFVEFEDYTVFYDEYESSGWGPVAQVFGGLDVSLTERLVLTGEARYLWSRTDLSRDFQNYDPIDLSGVSATVGISLRI